MQPLKMQQGPVCRLEGLPKFPPAHPTPTDPAASRAGSRQTFHSAGDEDGTPGELPAPGYLSIIPETLQLIIFIPHELCGLSGGVENRTFSASLSLSLAWADGACKLLLRVRGSLFLIRLRFLMGFTPTTLLPPLLCSRGKCRMFFPVTEDLPSPCAHLSPLWACRTLAGGREESP